MITKKNTWAEVLLAEIELMIVDRSLGPGECLDEMVLAEQFGVSRRPVWESISALTVIGLAQHTGKRGAAVAQISVGSLIGIFELMAVLEVIYAQLDARRATRKERSAMLATHKVSEKIREPADHKKFCSVNLRFHDELYQVSYTQYLVNEAFALRRRLYSYGMRETYRPDRMQAGLGEHLNILKAVNLSHSEKAMDAARSYIRLLGNQLADFISSCPSALKDSSY